MANVGRELGRFLLRIGEVKAVIEAERSSYTVVNVLEQLGIETTVAHPKEVKAIARAKIKTDERESFERMRNSFFCCACQTSVAPPILPGPIVKNNKS